MRCKTQCEKTILCFFFAKDLYVTSLEKAFMIGTSEFSTERIRATILYRFFTSRISGFFSDWYLLTKN